MLRLIKKFFSLKLKEVLTIKRSRSVEKKAIDFYEALPKFMQWKFMKGNDALSVSIRDIMK